MSADSLICLGFVEIAIKHYQLRGFEKKLERKGVALGKDRTKTSVNGLGVVQKIDLLNSMFLPLPS